MYTQTQLETKSESQLAKIAQELDVDVNTDTATKSELVARILLAQATSPTESAAPKAKPRASRSAKLDKVEVAEAAKPRVRIIVHNQEGTEESAFVKVQVNGTMYALPREKEVTVPQAVVNVLNDAVITRFVREGSNLVEKSARRIPFTVLGNA